MNLCQALRAERSIRLALTGAGGKTTALFTLARQLDPPVWVATSAHLAVSQAALADQHFAISNLGDLSLAIQGTDPNRITLFTGFEVETGRLGGLSQEILEVIQQTAYEQNIPVLVEADGSRRLPMKAPAPHEPPVPDWANTVCVVCGLSALGKPLNGESVHRAERFASLTGLSLESPVDIEGVAAYLRHPEGGLKNIPTGARKVALLNQADSPDLIQAGKQIAAKLAGAYDAVLVAALGQPGSPVHGCIEPVAGIILAAGAAERFGDAKVLLEWNGKPFIRHLAEKGLRAGLDPVVVVTGQLDDEIRGALIGLPVTVINNPNWSSGQSSSLKAGLQAAQDAVGSAVFMLADQPHIPVSILRQLVQKHSQTLAPVIAPRVNGRRANPVLFDRQTFAELMALTGDVGGRAVFNRYPPEWLDTDDERLLLDVDTPEDYLRLLGLPPEEE